MMSASSSTDVVVVAEGAANQNLGAPVDPELLVCFFCDLGIALDYTPFPE